MDPAVTQPAGLEALWKALLVVLTVANVASSASFIVGRWTRKQESDSGAHTTDLARIDREVGELRKWRHDVALEETRDMAALFRGFVTREEFKAFTDERREETTRIWAELNRLRNGKH